MLKKSNPDLMVKVVVLPLPKAQFMALYSKIRTLIKNDWTLRPGMRALRGCT